MKTLILCVDRDDDLGRKANIASPVVGRRHVMEAAMALGVADPEDSDTNALFAAVHLFDAETERHKRKSDQQWEVAAIAGHKNVGMRSDRELARQVDQVLASTHAEEIVLVTDGAEDEQIMPILTSRARVVHIHRSIVKQTPRLEGFLYTLTRMLDDDKLAKRFLLPLGLVFIVWGVAAIFGLIQVAVGLTVGIIGVWLLTHAMQWEHRVGRFFQDFGEGLRTGKVAMVANIAMIALLIVGAVQSAEGLPGNESILVQALYFLDPFLFYLVSALLVRTAGKLFDGVLREGRASLTQWTWAFTLIAFGFIGGVLVDLGIAMVEGETVTRVVSLDLVVRLLVGVAVMASGIIVGRYVKNFFKDESLEHA